MSYTPPPPPPEGGSEETPGSAPPPPQYGAPPPPPPGYGSGESGYGGSGYGGPGQPVPGYGGPAYGGPPRNSSKAVAALVIGIVSPLLGFCCAIIGLVGIVAVVLGRSAQKEIALSMGALTGDGMAKAGVILGIIGSVIGVLMTILNVILLMNGDGTFDFNTVN
ncbi:MAG: DUF4190 domain-containing protein [Nocardioides sp.]